MSFDPISLKRLRELRQKLPKDSSPPADQKQISSRKFQTFHKIEIEDDPIELFHELIKVSEDGRVSTHMIERLKNVESEKNKYLANEAKEKTINVEHSAMLDIHKSKSSSFNSSQHDMPSDSEEYKLYIAFRQLLLEEDEI